MQSGTGAGRELPPTSAFAGDDGSADAELSAALVRHAEGAATLRDVVVALSGARVLVPVLAELEVAGHSDLGLDLDKEASTGIVALRAPDGRTALPVFTSTTTLAAWRPDARPVPAQAPRAALSAAQEGWEVLVVDPAGPVTVVVPRPAVRALATGTSWDPAVHGSQVRPEVRRAVVAAVSGTDHVLGVDALPGRRAEVAVVLALRPGLDRAALDMVLARVNARLAADDVVTTAVDSIELRLTTASP
ncbi:SseB family protein [Actinotalea sp. K2]|uniref:SseB family protein n=1 Tax=Actinotalea sp. K2 TaxID=2939438 RepID=UPI002017FAB8|nr:SseB family protein [Actinotalea sp. K2]MCL3860098.1 SseB family protein [Actinotalea sp. K2]